MALEEIRQVSSHRQWPHARGRHRTPTPMGPPPVHTHERWHVRRHPRPWFHTALNKLAKAAWDPNTPQIERYWTGQLTASQLANAFGCNISTPLPEYQFHKLEQSVTKILLPLYNGGMNMLKNRGCRHHNIKVTPLTQPSTPTSSQPHRTHTTTNSAILQLFQATSTPRAKPPTRTRSQRRPANPARIQTTLTYKRNPDTTGAPGSSVTDSHPRIKTPPSTSRTTSGSGRQRHYPKEDHRIKPNTRDGCTKVLAAMHKQSRENSVFSNFDA